MKINNDGKVSEIKLFFDITSNKFQGNHKDEDVDVFYDVKTDHLKVEFSKSKEALQIIELIRDK